MILRVPCKHKAEVIRGVLPTDPAWAIAANTIVQATNPHSLHYTLEIVKKGSVALTRSDDFADNPVRRLISRIAPPPQGILAMYL